MQKETSFNSNLTFLLCVLYYKLQYIFTQIQATVQQRFICWVSDHLWSLNDIVLIFVIEKHQICLREMYLTFILPDKNRLRTTFVLTAAWKDEKKLKKRP